MPTAPADQQPAKRVLAGVPAPADGNVLFVLSSLHLILCQIEELLRYDRRMGVFRIVHGSYGTVVPDPALG